MIWDLAIGWFGLSFVVSGWFVGLRNSWPAPIAMMLATVITQFFYQNFSAFLVQELRLPSGPSVFLGYVLLWLFFEFVVEVALVVILPIRKGFHLSKWNKAGGACMGLAKALIVVIFACLASICADGIPVPPKPPLIALWLSQASRESVLLRLARHTAVSMPATIAQNVVASEGPSFTPAYNDPEVAHLNQSRVDDYARIFHAIRDLEGQVDSL
jgi:hypothetical protein